MDPILIQSVSTFLTKPTTETAQNHRNRFIETPQFVKRILLFSRTSINCITALCKRKIGSYDGFSKTVYDADILPMEKKIQLTKSAVIAKSTTNYFSFGHYDRATNNAVAAFLENVTTINGDYTIHNNDASSTRHQFDTIANDARAFLQSHFSSDVQEALKKGHGTITDPSGMVMNVLYEKSKDSDKPTIHVVFSGTFTGPNSNAQIKSDVKMILKGGVCDAQIKSDEWVKTLKASLGNDANLKVCGFSFGGALASYAGLANDVNTVTLGTVPLGQKCIKALQLRTGGNLAARLERLTNLYVAGDHVATNLPTNLGTSYKVHSHLMNEGEPHRNSALIWINNTFGGKDINIYSALNTHSAKDKVSAQGITVLDPINTESLRYEVNRRVDTLLINNVISSDLKKLLTKLRHSDVINKDKKLYYHQLSLVEKALRISLGDREVVIRRITQEQKIALYCAILDLKQNIYNPTRFAEKSLASVPEEDVRSMFSTLAHSIGASGENPAVKANINQRVLQGGDEIWPATYNLMVNAKKSVHLQTYILDESSEAAKWVHKSLNDMQKAQIDRFNAGKTVTPIEVNFYIDVHRLDNVFDIKRKNEGNDVSFYGIGYPRCLDPRFVIVNTYAHKTSARGSLHSKTTLIDDEIVILTSSNLKDVHSNISADGESRNDVALIMTGEVIDEFKKDIHNVFEKTQHQRIGSNEFESEGLNETNARLFKLPEKYYPASLLTKLTSDVWHRFDANMDRARLDSLNDELNQAGNKGSDVVVISKSPKDVLFQNKVESSQRNAMIAALSSAQHVIKIIGPNLNAPEVMDELVLAMKRGVKIEIVLPITMLDFISEIDWMSNLQAFQYLKQKAHKLNKTESLDLRWQGSLDGRVTREGVGGENAYKIRQH